MDLLLLSNPLHHWPEHPAGLSRSDLQLLGQCSGMDLNCNLFEQFERDRNSKTKFILGKQEKIEDRSPTLWTLFDSVHLLNSVRHSIGRLLDGDHRLLFQWTR